MTHDDEFTLEDVHRVAVLALEQMRGDDLERIEDACRALTSAQLHEARSMRGSLADLLTEERQGRRLIDTAIAWLSAGLGSASSGARRIRKHHDR